MAALDAAQQAFLSRQARLAIESGLSGDEEARPLEPEGGASLLTQPLGSFVTLKLGDALRGCIGTIVGREPLWLNVWRMARAAAFEDPRFPPLSETEWGACGLDISVLDAPVICPDPGAIVIGRHGLILQHMGRTGVFLPQVPVEQGWSLPVYLSQLCAKAGLPDGSWQAPGARLFWYTAQVFEA